MIRIAIAAFEAVSGKLRPGSIRFKRNPTKGASGGFWLEPNVVQTSYAVPFAPDPLDRLREAKATRQLARRARTSQALELITSALAARIVRIKAASEDNLSAATSANCHFLLV
jgi:hypothetical protein